MTSPSPSLSLDQCVEILKRQLPCASKAPKEIALLYAASVGLLCHLKKDQATLYCKSGRTASDQDQQSTVPCPSAQEIPAITRILQDSQLFLTLVACLQVPDATDGSVSGSGGGGDSSLGSHTPRYNRKRSYSFQSDHADHGMPASKLLKLQHSPKKVAVGSRTTPSSDSISPSIPIAVLAATVLYSAFQHVDHWPAQLVQAYAEDAFGPRLWVDDDRCSLLVQNLATSHCGVLGQESSAVQDGDATALSQATQVAQFYEHMTLERSTTNESTSMPTRPPALTPQPIHRHRSTSLGSTDVASSVALPSDSDSDSGDDMECLIEVSSGRLGKAGNGADVDESSSSSSSGMSGAEVVETSTTLDEASSFTAPLSRKTSLISQSAVSAPTPVAMFPGTPASLNLERVRRRYVGVNLDHAHQAILTSLSDRLDVKSKQNSKLLTALPSFICIPAVRRLAALHLERWLQSPALSGQARSLFAATVQHMRNIDPPLPDDLQAIDSIMKMRLKANQVNMRIENVTEMAKRIPNVTVAQHIFLRILREELTIFESGTHVSSSSSSSPTEPMRMIQAVYGAFEADLACEGLAIALLTLLAEPAQEADTGKVSHKERQIGVENIRSLLRCIASVLGSKFDGCRLIRWLLSFDVNVQSWSLADEENRARLMCECATLLAASPSGDPGARRMGQRKLLRRHSGEKTDEEIVALRSKLANARKLLLDWCCNEYAPRWQERHRKQVEQGDPVVQSSFARGSNDEALAGVRAPDFRSVLAGEEGPVKLKEPLDTMRSVLFVVDTESDTLREFLYPGGNVEVTDPKWHDAQYRMEQCNEYGTDLDDEMLWIILKSALLSNGGGIDPSLALSLIEHLFQFCNKHKRGALQLADERIVWELYRLVEYVPSSSQNGMSEARGLVHNNMNFPRLAHPGMWWRVTMLALVICGVAPEAIGASVFHAHPTVRALIKMTTSGRYRFPTIDCNEADQKIMRTAEFATREEESRIAELLFLPPAPTPQEIEVTGDRAVPLKRGVRISARQREKQERLERQRREKEADAALEEANRRKRVLRVAQKSIVLWNPKGAARKPPKEVRPLMLAVNDQFGLSKAFQQNVNPDFLLMTIGQTTRGSIERAFDWVIPVISSVPESISRLPASASCFLLLRAYGEEGEGQSELRELSAPLVQHVQKSLTGEFGESSAVRSADLLLADLADPNPDRRRCVIRVLRETLGNYMSDNDDDLTGLLCLLEVDNAEAIVPGAINYISWGLSFERGRTLRALVIALDKYISFATERNLEGSWNFASTLCELISSRHNVCAEAMDRFPDFQLLAVSLLYHEFLEYANDSRLKGTGIDKEMVVIELCSGAPKNGSTRKHIAIPLMLLQSTCVLLSLWEDNKNASSTLHTAMQYFANALLFPSDHRDVGAENLAGLAGATFEGTQDAAMSVEMWILLAKSRGVLVARRAALSAPTAFLPRLILCSGLHPSSLIPMVNRLGKLGDKADNRDRVFKELLMPSGRNQWATSYPGVRKNIMRKLVGRLSAYRRLNKSSWEQQVISHSFLEWLSEESSNQMRPKKPRPNKKIPEVEQILHGGIVSTLSNVKLPVDDGTLRIAQGSPVVIEPLAAAPTIDERVPVTDRLERNSALAFIKECFDEKRPTALNEWLDAEYRQETSINVNLGSGPSLDGGSVCVALLKAFFKERRDSSDRFTSIVLKWVPMLSISNAGPGLWSLLFSPHPDAHAAAELLRNRCASIWCRTHTRECQQWILANHNGHCIASIIRFLIATSYQQSIHAKSFIGSTTVLSEKYWGTSEAGLKAGVEIALKGTAESCVFDVDDPVSIPDWLTMLLLLAKTRDGSMMQVCEMLLHAIGNAENLQQRASLQSAMLRLYTYFPTKMKLANPVLRGVLIEGAKVGRWLDWRSSLDPQLDDMVSSLKGNPSMRIIQGLMDLSKAHPLLVLRKLPMFVQQLENDASVPVKPNPNIRGRIQGGNLLGPLQATLPGMSTTVKVSVRHWGYDFTEGLWTSVVDVLLSIPREVLFSCGSRMGLGGLLGLYARLLYVQCQLQSNSSRVRAKFSNLINEFQATDSRGWELWLASKTLDVPSLDNMRNVLLRCSLISPPAAPAETVVTSTQS